MAAPLKLRIRAAGSSDFEVEVDAAATVLDVKIAATAGCDIDPQAMRLISKGRVLKDGDALAACGVAAGDTLHVARGGAAPAEAAGAVAASAMPAAASSRPAAGTFRLHLKGPGGLDAELDALSKDEPIEQVRALAAERCGLRPEQVHLVHKAKMLKDGGSLSEAGVGPGDVLRIARRQTEAPASAGAAAAAAETPVDMPLAAGAPMPNAWAGGLGLPPGVEEQARMAARAMGVDLEELLGGVPLGQAAAAAAAAAARQRPPAGENAAEMQARFTREAHDMARQVRAYLARQRAAAGEDAEVAEGEVLDEDDPELLADVASILAEARSRGAPVPNAAVFVDRAVARRREARALQARLDREASGLDPELEDAMSAAEVAVAAAARMPRRLGHGNGDAAGRGGGSA